MASRDTAATAFFPAAYAATPAASVRIHLAFSLLQRMNPGACVGTDEAKITLRPMPPKGVLGVWSRCQSGGNPGASSPKTRRARGFFLH